MKKLFSLCLSVLMMLQISPVTSFADDSLQSELENNKIYKYEEIMKMTDEDFIKTFPDSKYVKAGFGDDCLSFKEKLDNCFYPDGQISGECEHTRLIMIGNRGVDKQYIEVHISRYAELDPSFDPSAIGLPSDWETEPIDIIERTYYDDCGNAIVQR